MTGAVFVSVCAPPHPTPHESLNTSSFIRSPTGRLGHHSSVLPVSDHSLEKAATTDNTFTKTLLQNPPSLHSFLNASHFATYGAGRGFLLPGVQF